MTVEQKVSEILRKILGDGNLSVSRAFSSWDHPAWDSLANAQLLIELEEQFGVQFSSTEVLEIKNLGELIDLVEKKAAGKGAG